MDYNLIITEKAEELLDNLVNYLLYELKNQQAAIHLLDEVDYVFEKIVRNPYQYAISNDFYLASKHYREAPVDKMRYIVIYHIEGADVRIVGIYHQLELYRSKIN